MDVGVKWVEGGLGDGGHVAARLVVQATRHDVRPR